MTDTPDRTTSGGQGAAWPASAPLAHIMRAFVLLVALLAFGGGGVARAQESGAAERRTLTMGWVPVPPFFETETDGSRTGFSYELGVLLAEELGAAFEIRDYAAIAEYYQAQNSGETDFAPGISAAPSLAEFNVFSDPVAESRVGLFVLAERAASIDPATVAGLKIATFPYGPGSDVDEVVSRNINVPFNSTLEAIFALLSGKIDAILTAQTAIFVPAYAARVDHRIVAVGAPLQKYGRSVVLHRSRADMLAPMNAAIAKLEEDGRLQALRRKYFLEQLLPLPDVLTVGVAHSPPYGIIEPDGSFSGFAVEFFRDLADEAGIKIKFVAQTLDEYFEGPGDGRPDAFPLYIVSDDLRDRMDFTNPIRMTPFSAFTLASNDDIRAIEDLAGQRVGLKPDTIDVALANGFGDARLVSIPADDDLLQALLDGDVAAITDAPEVIRKQVRARGVQDAVREVRQISFAVEGAIVLRFGLGEIRERLNAQLPVYLISEQYRELRARYFGPRTFWTPRMQVYARIAAWSGVVAFILLGSFTYLSVRARRQAEALTRETVSISNRLNAVLNAAQSGIIGLDSEGRVMIANPEARHMLGGISDPVPFNWPENVAFLDSEHMHPLDASEDPLRRAVLGHRLRGIITLMTRPGVVDPRYVRLTSARIAEQKPGSVRTVLVIDDVSEQEKNRQQFERASRLDALGQLTGGIAHDFNNVLATIQYAVQLAQMRATDERVVSYLSRAVGSVERGAELTRRLLAFAKRQPGLAKSVPVEHVFEEFAALARPTIEEHVTLDFVADDDDLWVYCDAAQLENALLNLVINSRDAIIASGRGDQIVVRARGVSEIDADRLLRKETPHSYIAKGLHAEHAESRAEGGERAYRYIEFAVTDNGPGMSDEVKRRAIDPFFTTKDASSGTGLGLSMVYGFVQQANGELRIYSEVDHGTTVRVLLPRGTNDGQRERPVARMPVPTGEGQRIFIVEDEDDLRMTMSEVVESLGYQALMASSGREALEMVKKGERFDVLLTDVVMPGGVGGFELAREVRALMPHMPVIYMSGYTGFSDEEMGEVVAPLIQKPCPPFELGEALEKALNA